MSNADHSKPTAHKSRKVPPLAWIVLALAVVVAVLFFVQRQGTHVTPTGTELPQAENPGGSDPATSTSPT